MDRLSNRFDVLDKFGTAPTGHEGAQASGALQSRSMSAAAPHGELTRREQQVIQALSQGWSNKRIASELFVTQHTVKFHLKASYRKIGVRSRTEAVYVASRLGLVQFP